MTKDYYKILGVTEFDTAENIKIAYRRLARKCHPDIAGESAEALLRFKDINEAYEILSNKIKKDEYDRARKFYNYAKSEKKVENQTNSSEEKVNKETRSKEETKSFNWKDYISKFGAQYSKKNGAEADLKSQNGDNIYTDIEISVLEAMSGIIKTINMLQTQVCPKCGGRKFANGRVCSECNGKGEVSEYKKFNIKIPAGVVNKSKIRLAGEGNKGRNGGKNGDLFVTILIKEPKDYKTEGLNILKTIPITPYEAVLGANISITTINGKFCIKLPPHTQNGQKFRLNDCGLMQNNKFGDMIITVEIQIPRNLSSEELDLYKKLEEVSSSNIRDSISY